MDGTTSNAGTPPAASQMSPCASISGSGEEAQNHTGTPHGDSIVSPGATQQTTGTGAGTNPDNPLPTIEVDSDEEFWAASSKKAKTTRAPTPGLAQAQDESQPSDEDAQALADYEAARELYQRRKRSGKLTMINEVEWRKAEVEEQQRIARLQLNQDREDSDDEPLFVQDTGTHPGIYLPARPAPGESRRKPGRSQRRAPKFEQDDDPAHPAPLETPKTARKRPSTSANKSKAKKPRKNQPAEQGHPPSRPKGKKPKKPTKKELAANRRAGNLLNANSLTNPNVFRDVATNQARSAQPVFTSKYKAEALRELVAGIPAESRQAARTDMRQLEAASRKFSGQGSCKTQANGEWFVKGMRSTLTHYQMLGVSAMREREAEVNGKPTMQPAGGIHADAMGLGKTVMAIANMVNDRYFDRKSRNTVAKPTLIVAPSSIIYQWMEELKKHAFSEILGSVMKWNPSAVFTNDDIDMLLHQGVVITTYSQIQKSMPKRTPPVDCATPAQKQAWWEQHYEENKGVLHKVHWRRIILDEANAIKNHLSQTSDACNELSADFRWALTGTPAMNSLCEFYAYFRFLKAPNTHSYELFKRNFTSEESAMTGNERLIMFLRPFMIRRTHNDEMFGAKLLDLPTPARDTYWCHFTPLHRALYNVVRERFIEKINVMSAKGELKKQYRSILTLILRLRQLAGHPLLIQDTMHDLLEPGDFLKIEKILNNAAGTDPDARDDQSFIISHLRRMLHSRRDLVPMEPGFVAADLEAFLDGAPLENPTASREGTTGLTPASSTSSGAENHTGTNPEHGRAFGLKDSFAEFLGDLKTKSALMAIPKAACVKCGTNPKEPILTSCGHVYCYTCNVQDSEEAIENQTPNICADCGTNYSTKERYDPTAAVPNQTATELRAGHKENPLNAINKWINPKGQMLPSAKTVAFKAQVLNWIAENPNVKIIVYSQFITMIKILSRICAIEHWGHHLYHGGLSQKSRNQTIKKFTTASGSSILIASLRTGGVGLNLTAATRVLMIDPWWNTAVEEQAFCRTYRRGQTLETAMTRLVVSGTVDQHILALQEHKERVIQGVMAEGSQNAKMSVADLLRLFGPVGEDDAGNEFVFVDRVQ